jgi:hypothetical protein
MSGDSFGSIGNVNQDDFRDTLGEAMQNSGDFEEIQVWLDLDGVLADMQSALEKNEKLNSLKDALDYMLDEKFPEWKELSNDNLKSTIYDAVKSDPKNIDLVSLKKAYKNYNEYIFSVAGRADFYFTMDLMPGALDLVQGSFNITGRRANILSSPIGNEKDKKNISVLEKRSWVYKNFSSKFIYIAQKYFGNMIGSWINKKFGNLINKVEITSDKARVIRGPGDILIDDRQKYVDKFIGGGGSAILFKNSEQALSDLKELYSKLSS